MVKLIISDLDGTILKNGAQQLPDGFIELVKELRSKNIAFAVASGRQYQNIQRMFVPIQNEISYIAENGSLCVYNNKVIYRGLIQHELGLEIMKEMQKRPELNILLSCEKTHYIENKNPEFINRIQNIVRNDVTIVDNILSVQEPFLKLAGYDPRGNSYYASTFQQLFDQKIKVVTSGTCWFDFIAPNTNKGIGLSTLMNCMHISKEECIAFGDEYNDIEMLQAAGTSYAMIPCAMGVEQYATNRTDSVEKILCDILNSDY
ncbi:Sugar phosphatase YbiV [Clostridiales bacterium CHKCI001]|nr:Sugar phosphatase YbiV [Clostridiales bacterium CHKCI001]